MSDCLLCGCTHATQYEFVAKDSSTDTVYVECPVCGDYLYEAKIEPLLTPVWKKQFLVMVQDLTEPKSTNPKKPNVIHLYLKPLVQIAVSKR